MTTHFTVTINYDINNALNCAYKTLLSFETVENSYVKENIYTIYGLVEQKIIPRRYETNAKLHKFAQSFDMPCLISLKPITNNSCEAFISVSMSETNRYLGDSSGRANEFIGEFLKRFSDRIKLLDSKETQ